MEATRDPMSLSDTFSVFFEDGETDRWSSGSSLDGDGSSDDEGRSTSGSAESKAFWNEQHQLLQDALIRRSSIEKRIRADTEEALVRRTQPSAGDAAVTVCRCCSNRQARRKCMLRELANHLRGAGYNSALCTSKWRKSPDIPSGEHSYVDVMVEGKGKGNLSPVRIVIEQSFRSEFEMARASEEYNGLVSRLPEVYVGKAERLKNVVKIMCAAAKMCMKENRMHMAPWRKHKYMQSKWLGTCERMPAAPVLPAVARDPSWQSKQRASMLTVDLLRTAVEVV